MKELNEYGYLEYLPSFNPYKGSLVRLFNLALEEEDLFPEKKSKYGENLSLFDLKNDPIIDDKTGLIPINIQSGEPHENKVIHTENQTGLSDFNLTKIDTGIKQALVPSINVINVINIKDKHKKENDVLESDFSKKIIPNVDKLKEKSCAKKETKKPYKKINSGNEVKAISHDGEEVMEIPTLISVLDFFDLKNCASVEGEKFFNYFQSNGWLVGGRTKMKDWNAAAQNWMLNAKKHNPPKAPSPITTNLHTIKIKNYNEPL